MKIYVMPKHMADLIAAGEVVERPSSVVKELMENAIDAGASSITVEIKGGGVSYLRVSDNGSGIAKEDLPLAFKPHATSKVKTELDLEKINTLGFRGEALSSICAVSKVEVLTMAENEQSGICYKIDGGEELSCESAGCPKGTTIIVRDLFYNTPARLKFLKKGVSESNYVASVVDKTALSHPEIKFNFIREGKQTLTTMGDGNLHNTIFSVFGKEFSSSLLKVDYTLESVHVWGYISKPTCCKANRSMQYFFVSSRQIKSLTAMSALENAYKNSVMVGKVPGCVLNIDVAPETVDVNVHPSKIEVRFQNEKKIFDAVYYACKNALMVGDEPKEVKLKQTDIYRKEKPVQQSFSSVVNEQKSPENDFWEKKTVDDYKKEIHIEKQPEGEENYTYASAIEIGYSQKKKVQIDILVDDEEEEKFSAYKNTTNTENSLKEDIKLEEELLLSTEKEETEKEIISQEVAEACVETERAMETQPVMETAQPMETVPYRVVGEVFKTYILVEQGNEMLIIDKHAAHERMIFEELKKQDHSLSQVLLSPVNITLSKEDYNAVLENADKLEKIGFITEDFGSGTIRVREIPLILENGDVNSLIEETALHLREHKKDFEPEIMDWLYHNVACRAAIKGGNKTSEFETEKFVQKLLSMPWVKYCPHGRPVMISMSRHEFEKQFGRV